MAQKVKEMAVAHDSIASAGASPDRIRNALAAFHSGGLPAAASCLRYVCWGLTDPFPREPLLRGAAFTPLLSAIEQAFKAGELSLKAWNGLLHGYLTAAADDVLGPGRANWLSLRNMLAETLPELRRRTRRAPAWLTILAEHENLLGDRPGARYARDLLKGETGRLDEVREALRIPGHSWFLRDVVLAQVEAACALPDPAFRAALDRLLVVIQEYPNLANESLVLLLTRYHAGSPEAPHEGLVDFAVAQWGSPSIFAQAKWTQVSPEVKAMVQAWLVRDDLKIFFEILQADRSVDARRVEFWLRYHKQMSWMRIALGSQHWYSNHPDMKSMRERRKDRVCRLEGGQGNLSAIIMKVGGHFLVEFSHSGNAAYGYPNHQVRFPLDAEQLPRWMLSDKSRCTFRESHVDRKLESWEQAFERVLAQDLGISPDQDSPAPRKLGGRTPASHSRAALHRPVPVPPASAAAPIDMPSLSAFCHRNRLKLEDRRAKGGAVWVSHYSETDAIARELKNFGLQYSPTNGWWRR